MGTGPDELRVLPEHLRSLSGKQTQAAGQISAAADLTAGEAAEVQRTHGQVCGNTHIAAQAAEEARARACAVLQTKAEAFAANLMIAASKYESTDESFGHKLSEEVQPTEYADRGPNGLTPNQPMPAFTHLTPSRQHPRHG